MNTEFPDIPVADKMQIAFCRKLGLNVEGDSIGVAYAKVQEEIEKGFWGNQERKAPSEKQIALAAKFGIDIAGMSRTVGSAVIDDIMSQLNANAIRQQELAPGVRVQKVHDPLNTVYVISSIREDGTVYFKGGNGQKAWARSLVKAHA